MLFTLFTKQIGCEKPKENIQILAKGSKSNVNKIETTHATEGLGAFRHTSFYQQALPTSERYPIITGTWLSLQVDHTIARTSNRGVSGIQTSTLNNSI